MTEVARKAFSGARYAAISALIGLASLLALAPRPALADIQYFYDEAGRLVQVVDHSGESAQYVYDAAGNIIQIIRVSAGTVSVAGFVPKSGPVGTAVTIYGAAFSATPASNTVQFNGTAAAVTSASANQLVATVPAGATSGTISVTVGAQTATSADSFTVTSGGASGAPTISGFTPGGGTAGTAVTITGTNFDPAPANNTARFNNTQAVIASATSTQLGTTVPENAGSGRISVRTPYGTALSANDFIVPPAGYAYADIVAQARVATDGPSGSLSIASANKHGIVLFDAAPSDWLSLQISTLSVSPSGSIAYKVLDPRNVQIASGNVSSTAMSIHLPALTAAGTYAILFSPGAATASLSFALKRNAAVSSAQPTANANVSVPGQSVRAVYTGTAGTAVTLRMGVTSITPTTQSVAMTLYKEGMQVATASGSPSTGGAIIAGASLYSTGTYFIQLMPSNAATASVSVTLDAAMDVAIDGSPLAVSTSTAGLGKRVLFSGTAGQQIGIGFTGLAYTPASSSGTSVNVYKPDGGLLGSASGCVPSNPGGGCSTAAVLNLPTTGTYQVVITPPSNVSFSGTLTLSTPAYSVLSSGTAVAFNITRSGQHGAFNFTGTAGQPATLRLAVASTAPANQNVTMTLWGPTGQVATTSGSTSTDGATLYIASLPASGSYGVIVTPAYSATGSMSITLNPAMDLAINGSPLAVSTSTAGQQRRLLFSATAGQQIGIGFTGLAYTPTSASGTSVNIYRPDGGFLGSASGCVPSNPGAGCNGPILNLPTTGTYQAVIVPPSSVSVSGTLTLSTPVSGTLSAGTPLGFNITRSGQFAVLSFTGTAGQPATLRLAIGSMTPANQSVTMMVWGPTGQVATTSGSNSTDGATLFASLPANGSYYVFVTPSYAATGSMTLTLNPAMDLAIDGSPLAVSTSTSGYQRRLLFSATAGQQIGLGFTGLAYTPSSASATSVMVYAPNGGALSNTSCTPSNPGAACNGPILNLPTTGTYQVVISPPSSVSFSGTLTLSTPVSGPLSAGTPLAFDITRSGQFAVLSFTGTAGQPATLRLAIGSMTPANQSVTMMVWGPTGQVATTSGSSSTDGATLYLVSLPANGTYFVFVTPSYAATGSMTLTLNPASDLAVDGTPSAIGTTTAGYTKRFVINATPGQRIGIGISGNTHTPANASNTSLILYAPNGSNINSNNCSTSGVARCEVTVNSTVQGPYTVAVTPPAGVNFSGTATVSNHATGSLTIGGGALAVSQPRDGQDGWYTFSGTAGQLLRLAVTGMVTTPTGQSVWIAIIRPNGTSLASTMPSAATSNFDIPALDATGTHAIWVSPIFGAPVDMNLAVNPR